MVLLLIIGLVCFSCYDKQPNEKQGATQRSEASNDTVVNYDSVLNAIVGLQNLIYTSPEDFKLIPPLLISAFDTVSGTFYTVGKGVADKSQPEATWLPAQKTAASADAKRWALYLKAWRTGNMQKFGSPVSGSIMYSRTCLQKPMGDTLLVMLQIPLGSIVLK